MKTLQGERDADIIGAGEIVSKNEMRGMGHGMVIIKPDPPVL
jgi:hypothetical protein